jgi:hypothetical protein
LLPGFEVNFTDLSADVLDFYGTAVLVQSNNFENVILGGVLVPGANDWNL